MPNSETTDNLSRGFLMRNNIFDEASLKSFLEAFKAAGINLTGLQVEKRPDGRYLVNHDPKDSTGPTNAQ